MKKNIVVVGGGTGTFTILSGLKKYINKINLSVVVSMMDDGGSNRVIRDEFGLLPTSDLRQCMVALASKDSDETLRKLFTYRYENGTGIAGMTFGNLFMAALTDIYKGNQKLAIEETQKILGCVGEIVPITYDDTNLIAKYKNGRVINGQHNIVEPKADIGDGSIKFLKLSKKARINKNAVLKIKKADLIIFGPGDLYTSIVCNFLVDGFKSAIKKSLAKKVYVLNLMTKFGETSGYKASDFIKSIENYLNSKLDYILINKKDGLSKKVLNLYRNEKADLVSDDLVDSRVIRTDLVSTKIYQKPKSDKLQRSLIRHDSDKLAKEIIKLI